MTHTGLIGLQWAAVKRQFAGKFPYAPQPRPGRALLFATARLALFECKTAMEAKQIADVAEMARVYLERTNASVETVNRATEVRLLAERQMGEFLKQMPKNTGALREGPAVPDRNHGDTPPTLREIGITKKQSAMAQKLAEIPAQEFKERVTMTDTSTKPAP